MNRELFDYDNYIDQDFPDVEDEPITTSVDDDFEDDKAILDKKNKIQESAEEPQWEIQYFKSTGKPNKIITGWDAFDEAVEEAETDWEINNIWAIGPDADNLPYWTEEEGLHEDLQETVNPIKKPTTNIDFKKMQEAMEENEDEVECAWCNELYPKTDCVKEVDLGWLCPYCKQAIESKGEKLTFTNRESLDECDDQPLSEGEESSDADEPKTCEKCGTRLNDSGTCPYCDHGDEEVLDEANAPKLTDDEAEKLLAKADEIYAKYDGDRDYYYMKYLFDMCAELNDEGEAFITSNKPSEFERKANDVIEYIPVWRTHDATDHRLPIKGQPIKHGGKLFNKDGTIKKIEIEKNPDGYEDYWRLYVVD